MGKKEDGGGYRLEPLLNGADSGTVLNENEVAKVIYGKLYVFYKELIGNSHSIYYVPS